MPVTDIDAKEVFERAAAVDLDAQSVLTTVSVVTKFYPFLNYFFIFILSIIY